MSKNDMPNQAESVSPEDEAEKGVTAPDPPRADILSPASGGTYRIVSYSNIHQVNLQADVDNLYNDSRAIAYFCEDGSNCPGVSDPDYFFPPYDSGDVMPAGVTDLAFYHNQPTWSFGFSSTIGGGFDFSNFGLVSGPDVPSLAPFGDVSDFDNINETFTLNGYGTYYFRLHTRNYRKIFGTVQRKTDNEEVKIEFVSPGVSISGPFSQINANVARIYNANVRLPNGVSAVSYQWDDGQTGQTVSRSFSQDTTISVTVQASDGQSFTGSLDITINPLGCGNQLICTGEGGF